MNAARGAIERAALNVMEIAERSVGLAGMIAPPAVGSDRLQTSCPARPRLKNGSPTRHPLTCRELRSLRRHQGRARNRHSYLSLSEGRRF
jgi:hypothetical protein